MKIRIIPVHQSLIRPSLILGGERDLVIACATFALMIALGGTNLMSVITATVFWLLSMMILRRLAKQDAYFSRIYLRHIKQQIFYSAKSPVWRNTEGYKVKK